MPVNSLSASASSSSLLAMVAGAAAAGWCDGVIGNVGAGRKGQRQTSMGNARLVSRSDRGGQPVARLPHCDLPRLLSNQPAGCLSCKNPDTPLVTALLGTWETPQHHGDSDPSLSLHRQRRPAALAAARRRCRQPPPLPAAA